MLVMSDGLETRNRTLSVGNDNQKEGTPRRAKKPDTSRYKRKYKAKVKDDKDQPKLIDILRRKESMPDDRNSVHVEVGANDEPDVMPGGDQSAL